MTRARRLAITLHDLRDAADSLPDAIVLLDEAWRVRWFNRAAETLLGLRRGKDRGVLLSDRLQGTDLAAWLRAGARMPLHDVPAPGRAEGHLDVSVQPFGRRQRMLLARDISPLTRLEQIRRDFVANVSHELRTPLTAILGWVRLLRGGRLPAARVLEALAAIDRNTHVQTRLIDELLDVSRIVAGKVELEVEPVDFAAVVTGVVASMRQDPRAAAVIREPVLGADVFAVLGDPVRLQQVVSNLMSNAVKFTPPDGRVEVTLRQVEAEVELVVSDTGVGLGADELPHIFDRFHQVDRSNTRRHGGLGLGLAIVRHLVLMHGGQVRAESAGRHLGARFTMRLPCAVAVDRIPVAGAAVVTAGGERPLGGVNVLFVDDNIEARSLVGAILEAAGATVVLAGSAAEALAALAVAPVDVVLSDVGMPDVDGYDFMAAVRARERLEGRDPVPAIAVTAYATSEDRRRAVTRGFQAHVAKPIDPADLVRVVVAAVRPAPGGPRAG